MGGITSSMGAIDVQGLVNQLMAVESAPMQASQKKVQAYNTQLSDIGKLSASLSALQTAMTALSSGSFLQSFKVGSSDSSMGGVSLGSGGVAGTYVINTTQLAQSKQIVFDQQSDGNGGTTTITDPKATLTNTPSELTFSVGGKEQTIKLGDTESLQSMADKINSQGDGISASVVKSGDSYKMVLSSTESGSDKAFTIVSGSEASGSAGASLAGLGQSDVAKSESRAAQDAQLTVNGVSVTSGSNRLSGVVPGVDIDLYKAGQFTVTLSQDSAGINKGLQSFVDAYNQVLTDMNSALKGSLKGNASVMSIKQQLQGVLTQPMPGVDPVSSYAYMTQVGISIQKDGTLKLDQSKFNEALSKDPAAVRNLFGNSDGTGVAQMMNKQINGMLSPDGIIESSKTTINSRISIEKTNQDSLTARLESKRKQLVQQYTALNVLLAKMGGASNDLAGLMKKDAA